MKDLYYALSPQNDIKPENVQTYFDALSWALTNRDIKNIRNIAITGIYGSGKSSVIKTFQKKYRNNKDLKFLNISLATFSNNNELRPSDGQSESLQRLIELSILQQLLYRENDNILPDSRIRKIKRHPRKQVSGFTICSFVFLISLANVITGYNNYPWRIFLQDILRHRLPINNTLIYFVSLVICIIGSMFLLTKFIRFVYSIKISKLSFQNAEIKVDKDISKSILNHYLDEILYFFEATKYNIVVIEDLDRFEQTDVFTNLRKINLLLNESLKITRRSNFF
jgi:ABC-type multidrug transport system fused ATPase/permease subunit